MYWAPSEMAAYLQSGEWNRGFRPGGRRHLGVLKSERVLLCRKTLVWELDLSKFAGDLKAEMIDSADGPETGMLFEQMITNILITYPTQTSLQPSYSRAS